MQTFKLYLCLIVFGLCTLSNSSTHAAQMCSNLFRTKTIEPREVLSFRGFLFISIFDRIKEYEANPHPARRADIQQDINDIEGIIAKDLKEKNIAFEMRPNFGSSSADANLPSSIHWSEFVIKPGDTHLFNRLAKSLKRRTGVELVFNPFFDKLFGAAGGVFSPNNHSIYFSWETYRHQRPGDIEGHEIIHALMWAQGKGRISFLPKAPVLIRMFSEMPLQPKELSWSYQNHLSFDEMITYAYNIRYGSSRTTFSRGQVELNVQRLNEVSEITKLAVNKTETLILTGHANLKHTENENSFGIADKNNSFRLEILIPKESSLRAQEFALNEIQRAKKLADFNIGYFKDIEKWTDEKVQERAQSFIQEQRAFINGI